MHSAMWIVACAMLGRAVYLLVMGVIRFEILSSVPRESGGVMSTALIQDRLLVIAYTLHWNLATVKSGKQASVPGSVRAQVIKDIAKTADFIKGPWVRSVRTGYKQTDEKVERTALAVAEKIRSWQALMVFGGRNLEVVCDECARVYLLTVDGDWAAISAGPYNRKKAWLSHVGKVVRKLLALSIPGFSAWIIMSLPFSPFIGYRPIVVGTAILVTLVELLALVDPDIVSSILPSA